MNEDANSIVPTERERQHAARMLDEFPGWHDALTDRRQLGCDDPPGLTEAIRLETERRASIAPTPVPAEVPSIGL